ncbi:MFS transporter [Chloroflexus sp.]|uniref:MFS transporter n=1 Tax=Chloroflexus sp. TaxID=1904827 RepID=UPI00298ED0EB|nr:MFS transporter [Chloroflexus sp.]MDW8405645.1 MFS transporter [Chloroflexus sp.]
MQQIPKWVVASVCGALIVTIAMGIRQTFGVFLVPLSEALGLGREQVGLTLAIQNLVFGIATPFAGALADRYGGRRLIALGAIVYALGVAAVTIAASPLLLLLALGVVVGLAQSATTFAPVFGSIGQLVPPARRGFAFGLVTAGGSVGMFAFVPLAQLLIAAFGWQGALLALAAVMMLPVLLAPALGARAGRASAATNALRGQQVIAIALRHPGYALLFAGFFVCGFHVAFVATHLPAYLVDSGISAAVAAAALALIGLGNVAGSYLFGALGDRMVKKQVLSGIYFGRAIIFGLFLIAPLTDASALLFGLGIGLLWLGTVPLTSGVVAQLFGTRYLGMLYGFVFFGHQIGAFLGAWLGGAVYDRTGSYLPVWLAALALSLAATVIHWLIDDRPARQLVEQPV